MNGFLQAGSQRPLIVAHRGSSKRAPENTFAAFDLAVASGADGIEMDVRLAGDGVPVVFHDSSLKRMTGEEISVTRLTARELGSVSIGRWFNRRFPKLLDPAYDNANVPTLEAVLSRLKEYKGVIYVELKCRADDAERTAKTVAELLSGSPLLPQFIVKSFELDTLPVVREMVPEIRTAALFAPKILSRVRKKKRLIEIALSVGASSLSLHRALVTGKFVRRAHSAGLGVAAWTVDKPRSVGRAVELAVDALITNRPGRLLAKRKEITRAYSAPD